MADFPKQVPIEYHTAVMDWHVQELDELISNRDDEETIMRRLGAGGVELSMHRKATQQIIEVAARWRARKERAA